MLSFVLSHSLACGAVGSLVKAIPVVGALAGAPAMVAVSGASAWARGNVFIRHFESGGTLLDFDAEKAKEYYKAQFEEGQRVAAQEEEKTEVPA